jgi:hypothetical protein
VWVDHCSFTDSPANDPSGNNHDGQLDVKNSAFNVTLSYNHFMNHRKTCLLGHTTNQTSDTALKVTYFRNWFDGTYSRHPRVRFAKAHIINNLYTSVGVVGADAGGYGVGVTCNAQIYNEANYYENTPKPTLISLVNDPGGTLSGDPTGYIKNVDNYTYNSGALIDNLAGFSFNPRNYYSYEIVGAELVKDIVQQNAGVGKITIPVDVRDVSVPTPDKFSLEQNYPNPFNPATIISYYLPAAGIVQLTVYDVLGNEVQTIVNAKQDAGKHSVLFNASSLNSGVYFYTLKSASSSQTKKMLLIK